MGLNDVLARIAARHAHVLVVEAPGRWVTRAAVERHVLGRGWRLALSPADADVLAVCGTPGPELAQAVARLWEQMPGPRARVEIDSPDAVSDALGVAGADMVDTHRQRADSGDRPGGRAEEAGREEDLVERPGARAHDQHDGNHEGGQRGSTAGRGRHCGQREMTHSGHGGHGMGHGGHAGHGEMRQGGRGGMEHGGQGESGHGGHAGHGGMGHEGMDVAPGGIPLAHGGEDRDGLEMDLLHLRLGPVLAYWPAGLVLGCTLAGDVIVDAEATLMDAGNAHAGHDPTEDENRRFAARRCDNAAILLALAGWDDAASRARGIRDALLFTDVADPSADLDRLRRAVGRSWLLRWSLRRLGPLTAQDLTRRHLPSRLQGDARDRLLTMLDRAATSIAGTAGEHTTNRSGPTPVEAIADLVCGWDLATARLIIASLDLEEWTADRVVSHV